MRLKSSPFPLRGTSERNHFQATEATKIDPQARDKIGLSRRGFFIVLGATGLSACTDDTVSPSDDEAGSATTEEEGTGTGTETGDAEGSETGDAEGSETDEAEESEGDLLDLPEEDECPPVEECCEQGCTNPTDCQPCEDECAPCPESCTQPENGDCQPLPLPPSSEGLKVTLGSATGLRKGGVQTTRRGFLRNLGFGSAK